MTRPTPEDLLDRVLGPGLGDDVETRARHSTKIYLRSMDGLGEFKVKAKGRQLSASEALEAYGWHVLCEVASEGQALLCAGPKAAGRLLRERRDQLGVDPRQVAMLAGVDLRILERAEAYKRLPIRDLEKLARALGLDERYLSVCSEPVLADQQLGVRLRGLGNSNPRMTPHMVSAVAEAAWVASTQIRLQQQLGLVTTDTGITHSDNYGQPGYPAFRHGYNLARDGRQKLVLGEAPIPSLRELAEDRLNIPIVQSSLGRVIAGVTVEVGADRAIVVNIEGGNRNVLVRRFTIAHELGHLLYDSVHRLKELRVDEYDELEYPPHQRPDPVEQRANAFGVEFLAPQAAVEECYRNAAKDGVWEVMNTFGLSFTAARYHVWNALERTVRFEELQMENPGRSIDPTWESRESYSLDILTFFGIRESRAGRFSAVVVRAAEERLISWDSAAEMLEVKVDDLKPLAPAIRDLYPSVFS